ncbi:hypothetical protein F5141DRAFT_1109551, partial [Pisolithus sp. B1]
MLATYLSSPSFLVSRVHCVSVSCPTLCHAQIIALGPRQSTGTSLASDSTRHSRTTHRCTRPKTDALGGPLPCSGFVFPSLWPPAYRGITAAT